MVVKTAHQKKDLAASTERLLLLRQDIFRFCATRWSTSLALCRTRWAGAQAFSSFDTYLAPFVKVDNLSYGEVKKCIEAFIYGVNTPSQLGSQAPFSNITLDWTVPDDLAELRRSSAARRWTSSTKTVKRDGYGQQSVHRDDDRGRCQRKRLPVPDPTYSITSDFDWSDTENNRLLFEMTAKYGTPYFSNYINSDMKPSDVRSMCRRLRLDLRELRKPADSSVPASTWIGRRCHHQYAAYRISVKDEKEFYRRLDHMMDIAARSLKDET